MLMEVPFHFKVDFHGANMYCTCTALSEATNIPLQTNYWPKKNSKPDCLNITKSFSNCLPFLQTFISLSVGHWLKLQHHQTNTDICKQKLLFHLHKMQTKFQTCQGLTCLPTEFGLKIPSASSKFKNLLPYYHPILIGHACFTWFWNG